MDPLEARMLERWRAFSSDVQQLLNSERVPICDANPPDLHGIYIFYDEAEECCYVGQAQGSKGLSDRILSKHVCGADSHALQRAYKTRYPDRRERRTFIKEKVRVQWLAIEGADRIDDLERLLIWLLQPALNLR
jgi:excinuclease UvrABC nuclease subunit